MQAVGRIGSIISKSVYNVSGTFHPFGGSVDIIVVEQPDGSFKSSPWYVRFGKFQGVLKSKEKVVTICVNDVDANFHMYLDGRGEAYFLKEVDVEEGESFCSPPTSSGEEMDVKPEKEWRLKSKSYNYDDAVSSYSDSVGTEKKSVDENNALGGQQKLGFIFGKKRSLEVEKMKGEDESCSISRTDSLERAEVAANLLDLKWSTASPLSKRDSCSRFSSVDYKVKVNDALINSCCNESQPDFLSVQETIYEVKCISSNSDIGSAVCAESFSDDNKPNSYESSDERLNLLQPVSEVFSRSDVLEVQTTRFENNGYDGNLSNDCLSEDDGAKDTIHYNCEASDGQIRNLQDVYNTLYFKKYETESNLIDSKEPLNSGLERDEGDQVSFICQEKICMSAGMVDGCSRTIITEHCSQKVVPIHLSNDTFQESTSENFGTCQSFTEQTIFAGKAGDASPGASFVLHTSNLSCDSNDIGFTCGRDSGIVLADHVIKESDASLCCMPSSGQSMSNECLDDEHREARSLRSVSSDLDIAKIDHAGSNDQSGASILLPSTAFVSHNLIESDPDSDVASSVDNLSPSSVAVTTKDIVEHKIPEDSSIGVPESSCNEMNSSGRNDKRSYSFSRSKSKNASQLETASGYGLGVVESRKDRVKADMGKKLVRTLIPTSEQLASLKLEHGKNLVTFSFSTAMLGKQQVDARIFLWRWDTRIVISDVDGTITRSDLLGQVMPFVGMDWSQSGVAHLFSAIKENGYQLLFLSARSIAQAFHTRQFLINIKQDGKALPEGPVVISPDGLFPSLFREVIRRAPHEFKISCLEDIRELFPADRNPFYAGFGNRDTDEFSYLKVGIPRGKIFIINPKGEIVVNRIVDTKSYSSLHSLVHGMFPPMTSCEQEDFNSWNFWKLPPPLIDC